MIPKIIHYCWFGENQMSEQLKAYVNSWRCLLADYQFICWSESNINLRESPFLKEAYCNKKYAFISDYVRLKVLYEYGGIYLDTDVELLKDITPFLDKKLVLGFDSLSDNIVASCFIGVEKNNDFIKYLLDIYNRKHFVDALGNMDETPNTLIITEELQKYFGIRLNNDNTKFYISDNIVVYPLEYFHALDLVSGKVYKTGNTVAIHWHTLTWVSKKTKLIKFLRQRIMVPLIGESNYIRLVKKIKGWKK